MTSSSSTTTTTATPAPAKPVTTQLGDRIFAGSSRGAGVLILVVLAGVAVS